MIIVSDTSPLNYLILVKQDHVLPLLFSRLITTPEVILEMRATGAQEAVRHWATQPPAWLEVQSPTRIDPRLQLGKGETSAISLAIELEVHSPNITLLIDERDGRAAAKQLGLKTAGTLTVLFEGHRLGFLELPAAIDSLRRTSFHARESLLEEILRRGREVRGQPDAC